MSFVHVLLTTSNEETFLQDCTSYSEAIDSELLVKS